MLMRPCLRSVLRGPLRCTRLQDRGVCWQVRALGLQVLHLQMRVAWVVVTQAWPINYWTARRLGRAGRAWVAKVWRSTWGAGAIWRFRPPAETGSPGGRYPSITHLSTGDEAGRRSSTVCRTAHETRSPLSGKANEFLDSAGKHPASIIAKRFMRAHLQCSCAFDDGSRQKSDRPM